MSADLASSETVGAWKPATKAFICPPSPEPPEECDCGFVGEWERRSVYVWNDSPGHKRSDRICRHDAAKGRPPRPHDEGWYVIGGFDERCPRCGDIERFDNDCREAARFTEDAEVIVRLDIWNRVP